MLHPPGGKAMLMPKPDAQQLRLVQTYRQLVERYEAKDRAIDDLIMGYGGLSQNMPAAAHDEYRRLAVERLELLNQMRLLEQQLAIDGDITTGMSGEVED